MPFGSRLLRRRPQHVLVEGSQSAHESNGWEPSGDGWWGLSGLELRGDQCSCLHGHPVLPVAPPLWVIVLMIEFLMQG